MFRFKVVSVGCQRDFLLVRFVSFPSSCLRSALGVCPARPRLSLVRFNVSNGRPPGPWSTKGGHGKNDANAPPSLVGQPGVSLWCRLCSGSRLIRWAWHGRGIGRLWTPAPIWRAERLDVRCVEARTPVQKRRMHPSACALSTPISAFHPVPPPLVLEVIQLTFNLAVGVG